MSFETPPIFDEYPDNEDDVNNLMGGPEKEIESFDNLPIFDEDIIGDLPVTSTVMSRNLEVQSFSIAHDLFVLKNEVSRYEYEDPLLKPRSETTNERYFKFFGSCNTWFDFSFDEITELIVRLPICGLHNSIIVSCAFGMNGSGLLKLYQHILSFSNPSMNMKIVGNEDLIIFSKNLNPKVSKSFMKIYKSEGIFFGQKNQIVGCFYFEFKTQESEEYLLELTKKDDRISAGYVSTRNSKPVEDEVWSYNIIFHMHSTLHCKVCEIIFDRGNIENLMSKTWMEKLVLKSEHCTQSCKMLWFQKSQLVQENQKYVVNFCLGKDYQNEVWYEQNSDCFDRNSKISEIKEAKMHWLVGNGVRIKMVWENMSLCVLKIAESFLVCMKSIAVLYQLSFSCVDDMSAKCRMKCSYLDDFNESVNCMSRIELSKSFLLIEKKIYYELKLQTAQLRPRGGPNLDDHWVIHLAAQMKLTKLSFQIFIFRLVVMFITEFVEPFQQIIVVQARQKLPDKMPNLDFTNLEWQFEGCKLTNRIQASFELNIDIAQAQVLTLPCSENLFKRGVAQRKHGGLLALYAQNLLQFNCSLIVFVLKLYCCKEVYKDKKKMSRTRGRVLFNRGRMTPPRLHRFNTFEVDRPYHSVTCHLGRFNGP